MIIFFFSLFFPNEVMLIFFSLFSDIKFSLLCCSQATGHFTSTLYDSPGSWELRRFSFTQRLSNNTQLQGWLTRNFWLFKYVCCLWGLVWLHYIYYVYYSTLKTKYLKNIRLEKEWKHFISYFEYSIVSFYADIVNWYCIMWLYTSVQTLLFLKIKIKITFTAFKFDWVVSRVVGGVF